jgi:hypothetical protein
VAALPAGKPGNLDRRFTVNLYRTESSDEKTNAQRNLTGRTHYADQDTLRYFKARILVTRITDNGLLFGLVESVALDPNNARRGYRAVVFDVFGTVLTRSSLEDARKSKAAAVKDLWAAFNSIDAKAHTLKAIEEQRSRAMREFDDLAAKVRAL